MTVGGTPSIYYGDEQAFRGIKEERVGGDDAIRPAFPEDGPDGLAPHGWPIYHLHQELIGVRRRHPWLHDARTTQVELANEQLAYTCERGDDRIAVALNLGDQPFPCAIAGDVLAGAADRDGDTVTVPPHGWVITG